MAACAPPASEYDRLAPFYDGFTAGYAYERWMSAIEEVARSLGMCGYRALDIACGTGKSTEPLFARGYSVLACDRSEGMVAQARRKFPAHADDFLLADMRELPYLGQFDLILCLDDAINYLLAEDELKATFSGVRACLSPTGVFAFDLNSLATYRRAFTQTMVRESEGLFFAWRGEASSAFEAGDLATARVEIFAQREDGLWERSFMRHVQRHHPPEVVRSSLQEAGLECSLVAGQRTGARLEDAPDEESHTKLMYFARRRR